MLDSFDDIEVGKTLCRTEALTGEEIERHAVMLENMVLRGKLWQLLRSPTKLIRILGDMKKGGGIKQGVKQVWRLLRWTK